MDLQLGRDALKASPFIRNRFNLTEVPGTYDVEATYGKHYGRVSNPFANTPGEERVTALSCWGYKHNDQPTVTDYFVKEGEDGVRRGSHKVQPLPIRPETTVLVGCNIKFDNLWILSENELNAGKELKEFFVRGGWVWDVAYAEYLLSGQTVNNGNIDKMQVCSLNACAYQNGIPTRKLDLVKQLWEAGHRTEDIPEDVLLEYQVGDVDLTYAVYLSQVQRAREFGETFYNNLVARMDGLLATTFMEFNGLAVDTELGFKLAKKYAKRLDRFRKGIERYLPKLPELYSFNSGSRTQLSAFLFGGTVKYTGKCNRTDADGEIIYQKVEVPVWITEKKVPVPDLDANGQQKYYIRGKNAGEAKFKTVTIPIKPGVEQAKFLRGKQQGELKFKKVLHPDMVPQIKNCDKYFTFPGFADQGFLPLEKYRSKDEENPDQYSTAEEHLKQLLKLYPKWKILKIIQAASALNKDLGTYYISYTKAGKAKGMLTCVGPDGCIHHQLNHYITNTGRLSSKSPNLQNIPGADKSYVRSVFVSRFGADGRMTEGDYSQLEVVDKAVLSGDPVMKQDLVNGICQHCMNLALAEGIEYSYVWQKCKVEENPAWLYKRKKIKPFTFQSVYGGGALLMSEATGLPLKIIKKVLAERRAIYTVEAAFDAQVLATVKSNRVPSAFRTPMGMPAGVGYYQCETGTIYGFIESDIPANIQKFHKLKHGYAEKTGIKPTQAKNYPSQGLGGLIMQDALGQCMRWLFTRRDLWELVFFVNTVHDCSWNDLHNSVLPEVVPIIKSIMEDVEHRFNLMCGPRNWGVNFPTEFEVGLNMLHLKHYKVKDSQHEIKNSKNG